MKVLSFLLAIVLSLFVGWGYNPEPEEKVLVVMPTEAPKVTEMPSYASEGDVLNILCWNSTLRTTMEEYYDGYYKIDEASGMIGEVYVNWITTGWEEDYETSMKRLLAKQETAAPEDKIDLFLLEPDYAVAYVEQGYAVPLEELGISDSLLSDQYTYTRDTVRDDRGNLYGLTWYCCPGVLFYNCDIAEAVLGTSDPEEVQKYVDDWDSFMQTAELMADQGFQMISSIYDSYRVYADNLSFCWVKGGYLCRDDNPERWAADSKKLLELGAAQTLEQWSEDAWYDNLSTESNVFCHFGTDWFLTTVQSHMDMFYGITMKDCWGMVKGPQSFSWGGDYLCAATGTDNPGLVKDIMLTLTTDEETLREIAQGTGQFVNNKTVMEQEKRENSLSYTALINENPIAVFMESAETIDGSHKSAYDRECNALFQETMTLYFNGTLQTVEEAVQKFRQTMKDTYPELIVEN